MTDHTYDNDNGGRARGKRGIAGVLKRALVPVAAVAALAGGVAAVAPSATAASAPRTDGPTVPGHPNQLADATGHLPLTVHGPKGAIKHIKGGWVLNSSRAAVAVAQSATPAVDVKHAFTVSTWVWTGNGRDPGTAVSQGTGQNSSFELGRTYDFADHRGGPAEWSFQVNSQVGGQYSAYAPAARFHAANTWALLTGVWDPARHRAYLYVDGVLAASHYAPTMTTNPGGLVLGAAREGNGWDNAWNGLVGHVQVWNQALTPAQVMEIKRDGGPRHLRAAHSWLVA